jgi:Flp pilus assembly protein TadB
MLRASATIRERGIRMPLSEQEQRLLDEMERSLYHGDADFVAAVGRVRTGVNYTALVGGIVLAVAGVAVLLLGVLLSTWLIGALGFVAMFVGVLIAIGTPRRRLTAVPSFAGGRKPGFMDRLSARWERRRQR